MSYVGLKVFGVQYWFNYTVCRRGPI